MDLQRLSISQITTNKLTLPITLEKYRNHGIAGIGPWRDLLAETGVEKAAQAIKESGLEVTNYCAAGFFTMGEGACADTVDQAVQSTIAAMDEQKILGAPCLVVVGGPINCFGMNGAMEIIMSSLRKVAAAAEEKGVDLGLEVLHPMDITQWSMIRTIKQALDILDEIDSPRLGLMLDLYNTWWDPDIREGIRRAGNRIKGVHFADWRDPTRSFTDRTLPGRGVIPLKELIGEVEATGWKGYYDLEIFSDELWESDYDQLLDEVAQWFDNL